MSHPIESVLLGTAVGDSLGLPAENLPPWRIVRRWPGAWSQRFFFNRGMISDDTEHTVLVSQCLIEESQDAQVFQQKLAWKMRWWLLCGPPGIGFATLRAILKLWIGFAPAHSGIFSAGNGPSMRSAIIGVFFADNQIRIRDFVRVSTRLTHTDPKAETAARAVALTAMVASRLNSSISIQLDELRELWLSAGHEDTTWVNLVQKIFDAHERGLTVAEFVEMLGLKKGVTGYAYHTVPVALYAWLHHFGDYRAGVEAVLNCGGDTDSVGAITGALLAINGEIPPTWIDGLCDQPISQSYLKILSQSLVEGQRNGFSTVPAFSWFLLPVRNSVFFAIVLAHVCRRILP